MGGRHDVLARVALAAASGFAIGLSGAPREWTALGFVGPALLLLALERADGSVVSPRAAFLLGAISATSVNVLALGWVVGLLETFGHFPPIAAWPTAILLWVAQSAPFAIAAWITAGYATVRVRAWVILPAALTVASSLTPALFPWRLSGTQIPWVPYVQLAELGGEPLLDLLVAFVGTGAVEGVRRRSSVAAIVGAAALAAPFGYGLARVAAVEAERAAAPHVAIGVAQPNVGIWEKHDRSRAYDHLRDLHALTAELVARGARIVVWPETAYPFRVPRALRHDPAGPETIRGPNREAALLVGAITLDADRNRYNSAVAVEPNGRITGIADKVQLLAFGEYVPLWDYLPPLQKYFRRGLVPGVAPRVLEVGGVRVAVLNCYEDVLAHATRIPARDRPDVLVNITNDAWFGETDEPYLHQAVARLRAVETRRDFVRAVNTGVSSHTLATGHDAWRTETWVRDARVADVALLTGTTPWVRFGDLVTPALVGALAGTLLARRRGARATSTS